MAGVSRFECVSSSLMLNDLLRKAKRGFWACFGLGLVMHLSLMRIGGFETERKVVKPLTTQFVKRQPRLTKPLELRKRPLPKRRRIQRKMVSVKARVQGDRRGLHLHPTQALKGLARPRVEIWRRTALGSVEIEPKTFAGSIEGAKEAEHKIDMSLELLDINALDTGRYHALVVQDPEDKRSIRGFCRLGVIYSDNMYGQIHPGFENLIRPAFFRLVDAMNRYTDIKTDIFGKITLESAELSKTPWVYFMAFFGFELSDGELNALGKYLTSGGFVFADTYWSHPQWRPGFRGVVVNLTKALELQGVKETSFRVLPNTHPVYHCYFDFDGPPPGADVGTQLKYGTASVEYLEGLDMDGHLSVILSKKAYYGPWSHFGTERFGGSYRHLDPERSFQFGVNLIIFALTQEGSITHRLLDMVY